MQTWAKRGVHAALVTGGMLAVGSGVASASGPCPEAPSRSAGRATPPSASGHTGDGTPRHSGQCFAGELFPGESMAPSFAGDHGTGRHALRTGDPITTFTGTIDPVWDLLPLIENETTREIPVIAEATVPLPVVGVGEQTAPMLELAGWVAEPSTAVEHPGAEQSAAELPRGKHAQRLPGTPSDGFQRSLSWLGTIGGAAHDLPESTGSLSAAPGADGAAARQDIGSEAAPELLLPSGGGFLAAAGLVDLWDGVLGQVPDIEHATDGGDGLLDVAPDLVSGELPGPRHAMHRIPPALLNESLTTAPPDLAPRQDVVPLRVPGEALAKASEIPPLDDLVLRGDALEERTRPEGVGAPDDFPTEEFPAVADGGDVSAPAISRIVEALGGALGQPEASEEVTQPIPEVPIFTDSPLCSLVEVIFLDDLTAALPELQQVTSDPFRMAASQPEEALQPMVLPLLDDELPDLGAFQDEALSTPLHELFFADLEDTVVLERV